LAHSATAASPATVTTTFIPNSIAFGDTTGLQFNISNPNATALTGVAFSDTLPANLSVPNASASVCGGTVTLTAPSGISISAATINGTTSCIFTVTVTGNIVGTYNVTTNVTSNEGGASTAASAGLSVTGNPPTIATSFIPSSIAFGGTTGLQFDINNPDTNTMTGVAFSDTLPAGLSVPNASASVCGGTVTLTAPSTIAISGASLGGGIHCIFTVTVTGIVVGVYNVSTTVTSNEAGSSTTSNVGLTVTGTAPSLTTTFLPSSIAVGGTTGLQFSIGNQNASTLTGVNLSDTLPTGLSVPNASASVCGGTVTLTAPTGIALTGGTLASGITCIFTVTVTGNAAGHYTNTTLVTSNEAGSTSGSAGLTVSSPPTITKLFGGATVALNGSTTLTFQIGNPNTTALSGVAFIDSLPSGLVVASPPSISNTCNGTVTAVAGAGSLSLSGGTIAASQNCSVVVSVSGSSAGIKNNSVQVTSTEGGTGNTSNTSIIVVAPPVIIKAFGAAGIPVSGTTSLQFIIQNNNAITTLNGVGFSDTLPSGLVVATPNGFTASCAGGTLGTVTAIAGSSSISLSGTTINASSSCGFTINVTGTSAGVKNNTTGNVTSTEGGTGGTASSSLNVDGPPAIAIAFNPSTIALSGTTSLSFTLTNPAANPDTLTGVGVSDTLPTGLTVPSASASVCGGTVTLTPPTAIVFSGLTLGVAGNCQVSITVTGASAGQYTNTTQAVTSTNGGTGSTATANLTVNIPTSTAISPSLASPTYGQTETVTATVTSSGGTPTGSVTFTDLTTSSPLGTLTLNGSGQASFSTSTLIAGSHTIQAAYTPTGNFVASSNSVTFTVNKAVLTVTANNQTKVYGAPLPTLTAAIAGFVNGENASVLSGSPAVTTTATAASAVGNYPITPAVGTLTAANYTFIFVPGTISVTPATLTVTANNQTKPYGASMPPLTATITGFVNGDTIAVVSGSAAVSTAATATNAPGAYPIVAAIGTLAASNYTFTFVSGTLTINKAGTSASITPAANSITGTITPGVLIVPGAALPTGALQLFNGSTLVATATVTGGTATFAYVAGNLTAVYSGDNNYSGSTSAVTTFFTPATSSLTITSSVNPSSFGQAVTFTANLSTNGGPPGSPTGALVFLDGAASLGTRTLSGPQASLTTSALTPGAHTITAQYIGDAIFPAASASLLQTVLAQVTMSVTASPTTPQFGQPVTLTANVSSGAGLSGIASPTGQVTFTMPNPTFFGPPVTLGTGSLSSGAASINVATLPVGTTIVTAQYGGDSNWTAASRTVSVTVSQAATSTVLSLAMASGKVSLTASVGPVAPGAGAPSGTIQFMDTTTNTAMGSGSLSGGKASAQITAAAALSAIGHNVVAVYSGDNNFQGSTSAALPATVNAASSYATNVSAEEIVSLFGISGLAHNAVAAEAPTDSVAGTTVAVVDSAGTSRQAQIYGVFASGGQINFLMPAGTATGLALVVVTLPDGTTVNALVNVARTAAGVFTANMNGQGVYAGQAISVHADGSQTVVNSATLNSGSNILTANPISLGTATDKVYLVLYGTGLRNAASVTATLNGVSVPVTYFGAQGSFAGLDQINLGPLPASLAGTGVANLVITVDSQPANTVTVTIQ
jgi:uncharacterized repeat protein (TIGR01451 family)